MNRHELRKTYDNSPEFVKDFNTIIDIVISNFYQSKKIYDDAITNNTIQHINFSIKPNIKKWEIEYLESPMMAIINETHRNWVKNSKLHKDFSDEWNYLCFTMSDLKEYIHQEKFIFDVYNFLKNK